MATNDNAFFWDFNTIIMLLLYYFVVDQHKVADVSEVRRNWYMVLKFLY